VNREYLVEHLCFEIHVDQKFVGFFAIIEKCGEKYLDHLWIAPDILRQGIGRLACRFINDLAQKQGWRELLTYPDPPAEGFYLRQGFHDTGIRLPSRYEDGPIFSVFKKSFDGELNGEVRGLSHITLTVLELESSVSFFRDILGFRVLAERVGKTIAHQAVRSTSKIHLGTKSKFMKALGANESVGFNSIPIHR
jgi:hypothetical protein